MADEETIFNFNGTLQEKEKKVLTEDDLDSLATKINLENLASETEATLRNLATSAELDNYITKEAKALMKIEYKYCLTESKNNPPTLDDDLSWKSEYRLPTNDMPCLWCKITEQYSDDTNSISGPILIMEYKQGEDGFSPTVSSQSVTNGTEITITDKNGNTTFTILNGNKGDTPEFNFIPEIATDYSNWTNTFNIQKVIDTEIAGYESDKENYLVTFPKYPGTNVYIDPVVDIATDGKPSMQRMSILDYYNTYVKEDGSEQIAELTDIQIKAVQEKLGLSIDTILINDQLHTEIIRFCIPRGPKGEPAAFAENISTENITASIAENDEYSDNPQVRVTTNSSTDEDGNISSNLSFIFEGIRGQTGPAPKIENIDTEYHEDDEGSRIAVTKSENATDEDTIDLKFDFYNLRGQPGLTKIEHVINETPDNLVTDTPIVDIGTGQVESDEETIRDVENNELSTGTNYLKITRGKITPDAIVGTVKKINGGTGYGTANQDPDAVAFPWNIAPAQEDTDIIGARIIDELYQYLTQVYISVDSIDNLLENNQNLYIYDNNNNEYKALNWDDLKFRLTITKISDEFYRIIDNISNAFTFTLSHEDINENNTISWQTLVQKYQNSGYNIPFIYSYENSLYPVSLDNNSDLTIENDSDGSILTSLIENNLIDLSYLIEQGGLSTTISFDDVYSIANKFYIENDEIIEDSQPRYRINSVKTLATNLVNELLDLQDKVTKATKIAADDIILIGPAAETSDTEWIPKETDPDKLSRAKIWIRTVESSNEEGE